MIEAWLASALRTWTDDLADALVEGFGEEQGLLLYHRYASAMPSGYQDDHTARTAVSDIRRLEALLSDEPGDGLALHLYRPHEAIDPAPRLKLYRSGEPLTLSDVLPLLENMGTKVIDERPYEIRPADADPVWIYDFGLHREALAGFDVADVRERFEETLRGGVARRDRERPVQLARAARGAARPRCHRSTRVRQVPPTGRVYVQPRLHGRDARGKPGRREPARRAVHHPLRSRLRPPRRSRSPRQAGVADIEGRIDLVESLNEDRVLRSLLRLVTATLRTNFLPDPTPRTAGSPGSR